jgi:hypothetical protein
MKRIRFITGVLALLFLLAACRNPIDIHRPDDYNQTATGRFSDSFVSLWNGMNMYYVYWDIEGLNYWDDVWDKYKPKFDDLDARFMAEDNEDKIALLIEAHGYYQEFLAPLIDGHLNVSFNHGLDGIGPVMNKVNARFTGLTAENNPKRAFWSSWSGIPFDDVPDYFNYNFFEHTIAKYLEEGGASAKYDKNDTNNPASVFRIATGHIPQDGDGFILYFYFSEFGITTYATEPVIEILEQYLDDIADPDLRGVIIDLRGNLGGANTEIDLVLDRLIHQPVHFAYTRTKNGLNRLDYKPWVPYKIYPDPDPSERVKNNVPVVALVNDYSISCGELTPMAVRSMPTGYIVGTQTHGATGPRMGDDTPAKTEGGSFTTLMGTTFWRQALMAGVQTKGVDGTNYEGVGLTPDEVVEFNWTEFYGDGAGSGRDRQLEAAIRHIDPAYTGP